MNEKIFSHFTEKNYLSRTDNIVQLHFWHKYSFQRAPNQVEKLRKFQGVGGYDKHPLESNKCPPWERGGCVEHFLELHTANIYKFFQFFFFRKRQVLFLNESRITF